MLDPEDLPLHGMVVLDFSQFLAGPVAALRLADLGARVVKVERPVTGEIGRTLAFGGRWADGDTLSFHAMNRNKEAVVADLKDPGDLARVKELVARADALIQNFRPGVMERLGLDHASVRELNPGLVYGSASGYGDTGPWARRPGQDLLAQSVSAFPWVSAFGGRPVPIGLAVADHLMSCHLAEGITALLVRKVRTGRGGLVETSLLEAMLDLQVELLTARLDDVDPQPRPGSSSAYADRSSPYGLYPTADGYLALVLIPVARLGRVLGSPELAAYDDPSTWWTARAEVDRAVTAVLRSRTTAYWLEVLDAADVACAPVLSLEEMLEHPAFAAVKMTQQVERPPRAPGEEPVRLTTTRSPIRLDGEVLVSRRAAPRLGAQGHLGVDADPLEQPVPDAGPVEG